MYSIININKAQNVKQQQSHFLFCINLLSYSTITRGEGAKKPFRLTAKQIQLAREKQNSYLYLCQEKKKKKLKLLGNP